MKEDAMTVAVGGQNGAGATRGESCGRAEFRKVLDATLTENPKAEDLRELKRWLSERPELWRVVGNLADLAATSMITRMARYPGMVESLTVGRQELQRELGYEAAAPLERLLIESVVLAWMRYHELEMAYSRALGESHAEMMGEYWDKRVSAARCHAGGGGHDRIAEPV